MSDAKSPQDLSMDEILATIRRIIAEDERSSGAAERGVPAGGPRETAQTAAEADRATDVLELTDALNEDGSVRQLAPVAPVHGAPEPEPAPLPHAEMKPAEATSIEAKPAEASPRTVRPAPTQASPATERAADPGRSPSAARPPGANDGQLVSDVAALAAATAFGRLAAVPRTRREPPLVGGRPLDEIVCELLRPLLQTWLDENLPGIVERLVQAEIARISPRSGPG